MKLYGTTTQHNTTQHANSYTQVFGKVHPDVAQALCNLAEFYKAQLNYAEARTHLERAVSIFTSMFGSDHTKAVSARASLASIEDL